MSLHLLILHATIRLQKCSMLNVLSGTYMVTLSLHQVNRRASCRRHVAYLIDVGEIQDLFEFRVRILILQLLRQSSRSTLLLLLLLLRWLLLDEWLLIMWLLAWLVLGCGIAAAHAVLVKVLSARRWLLALRQRTATIKLLSHDLLAGLLARNGMNLAVSIMACRWVLMALCGYGQSILDWRFLVRLLCKARTFLLLHQLLLNPARRLLRDFIDVFLVWHL